MTFMKYAIIIPDGCADEPRPELDGRTPLQAATIPGMDEIARLGVVGRTNHVPDGFTPGSEVANLSLLGYDPHRYFTGRAPIEAAARGVSLGPHDWAIRCNLVCIDDQVMRDFTAGHISSDEARSLLRILQSAIQDPHLEFVAGVSYRNLLIYRGNGGRDLFSADTTTTAPHDLTDESIADAFPRGPGSDLLVELMSASEYVLTSAEINSRRRQTGQLPATHIWLWGLGQAPRLPSFEERFGLRGAMITAVDLLRGLASLIGWAVIDVPGATGYLDTDYAAKGKYAVEALDRFDIVCVHVEATDEASHEGNAEAKVQALEEIDRHIVGPIYDRLCGQDAYRILVTPDHPTLLSTKMHSRGFVPWCSCGTGITPDEAVAYSEETAQASKLVFCDGSRQMERFVCP
jgi:2,3-bisphosphoglycerate-independent phosphoglycerate mutase